MYLYDKFLAKTAFLCQNIEKVYTYIFLLFYADELYEVYQLGMLDINFK